MKIRQFQLDVKTDEGLYQTKIPFEDGLVIVRAANSRGKSTCFKAILVALGLEAMLTNSQSELPLTPAVTHELMGDNGNRVVVGADVYLEIENKLGQRITVHRTIKGERDWHLITIYDGPALSEPGEYSSEDYYVSRPGGATSRVGFHRELGKFLGWDLPKVATFEGKECPLYLQTLFPFVFVEQKKGWSTLHPPLPTQFRIREPHRRVVEFLLKLDAYKIAIRRQELEAEKSRIQTFWASLVERTKEVAVSLYGQIQAIPRTPVGEWPPQVLPSIVVPNSDEWRSLSESILAKKDALRKLVDEEIPKVEQIASEAGNELGKLEVYLRNREVVLARLLNTIEIEKEEAEATKQRIAAIKEDLTQNKDTKTLRSLGSKKLSDLNNGSCPVCHQEIDDSLVPIESGQVVMSLDENIAFLDEQRKTFEGVLLDSNRVTKSRERQVEAIRKEVAELRDRIRIIRQTLISDGRLPSAAAIKIRLELEQAIRREELVGERFEKFLTEFEEKTKEWSAVILELSQLPKEDVTNEDRKKLKKWSQLLQEQLSQYGFGSLPVDQIHVSTDTYFPEHDGFDLQASISASDLIRTIWAYLLGMMELARTKETNHPGILVFDEPRQQSAQEVSFRELMVRGAESASFGQQVIFFTSEELSQLQTSLRDVPHDLVDFGDDRLLKRVV